MMRKIFISITAIVLSGCLEPQPKPILTERPISDFTIEVLAEGLKNPWSVAEIGSEDFFVTEKAGKLYYIAIANSEMKNIFAGVNPRPPYRYSKTEFVGLPDDIFVEGQGGLLDVVLSPNFYEKPEIYLSYAFGTSKANGTALISAELGYAKLKNTEIIFRASPSKAAASHFGGRIVFLPDDTLVLTLGDGFAYREEAQNVNSHLGKIVRLNRDGGTPSDNPKLNGKPQIYSMGHRNVQGIAYDAQTGQLWEHEHGPRGGDELNLIKAGANYGWPIATTGLDYNGAKISPIYRGDMFPEWNGDALIGGLVSRDIRLIDLENGKAVSEVSVLSDLDERVRDIRIASDGAILVLTDDPENGKLLRVTPKK